MTVTYIAYVSRAKTVFCDGFSIDKPLLINSLEFVTARKRSLRRLCFYTCLSVILFKEGCLPQCMMGYIPPAPGSRRPPRRKQALPGKQTPSQEAVTPWEADTLPGSSHPPGSRHAPPRKQTPPRSRPPPGSRHPLGSRPPLAQCMLGDTANKWAYASYWNAYLFLLIFKTK